MPLGIKTGSGSLHHMQTPSPKRSSCLPARLKRVRSTVRCDVHALEIAERVFSEAQNKNSEIRATLKEIRQQSLMPSDVEALKSISGHNRIGTVPAAQLKPGSWLHLLLTFLYSSGVTSENMDSVRAKRDIETGSAVSTAIKTTAPTAITTYDNHPMQAAT